VLALRPEPHVADPIRALRHAPKRLLRDHGLRVVTVREQRDDHERDAARTRFLR